MFFDIPKCLKIERIGKDDDGYHIYRISGIDEEENKKRTCQTHVPFQALTKVLIMAEEKDTQGQIGLVEYNLSRGVKAQLWLWLAEDPLDTFSRTPDIKISGNHGGEILTKKRLSHKDLPKVDRTNRFVRSKKNLRVARWKLVNHDGNVIVEDFVQERDDLYYFYLNFYHPASR